jgi:hypothetical protein
MGATTNCTVVHYGTTWDDSTLLEEVKQTNLELEKKDGIQRHFRYDYQEVGKYNPEYLIYVEMERQRLGENHPLFLTQYRLLLVHGGGGFLNSTQKAQLQGDHSRLPHPEGGKIYVAGIDLAGEAETEEDVYLKCLHPKQDSTVITIAELEFPSCYPGGSTPHISQGDKESSFPATFLGSCHPGGATPLNIRGDEGSGAGGPLPPNFQLLTSTFPLSKSSNTTAGPVNLTPRYSRNWSTC